MAKPVSKKKFKITIASLCLGFLMVVGAVIGVWSATTQNFSAGFRVNYKVGENVAAKIKTQYYVEGDDKFAGGPLTADKDSNGNVVTDGDGYVSYIASENATLKSVQIEDDDWTIEGTPKIEFYFTIKSDLKGDDDYIQVLFDDSYDVKTNFKTKVTYYNLSESEYLGLTSVRAVSSLTSSKPYDNIAKESYKIIKVEATVENTNLEADLKGNFNIALYYDQGEQSVSTLSKLYFRNNMSTFGNTIIFDYAQRYPLYPNEGVDYSDDASYAIWSYTTAGTTYILSDNTIALPEDSSVLFSDCKATSIIFNNVDTSDLTNMSVMFEQCIGLTSLDLSRFDTSEVVDMMGMFEGCINLTSLDLSSFNTSNVENMSYMFDFCEKLINLDLSSFDTSNVEAMSFMFEGCETLNTIYVSNLWSTESVTNGTEMFSGCINLVGGSGVVCDDIEIDETMANYTTGYLTYKAVI